ncbi:RNA helicase [Scheffersomyces spartinae]|uniref:ATP-dependent RNA helicase n=1 Tax=Scheffersomyces spartinae TaxID=45513 RepID=A0A9P7VA45_9ASCO|nr:RNA helicase [Scheffersomyces spartinae]KAG7194092.1 RNA helicase [Scheffersomyces spartinae]
MAIRSFAQPRRAPKKRQTRRHQRDWENMTRDQRVDFVREAPEKEFNFGKFMNLGGVTDKTSLRTEQLTNAIRSFDELRIFPTVRYAMKEEIRHGYLMRNTYVKSKEELTLTPTSVQIAAIKRITQPRVKNVNSKDTDSSYSIGNNGEKIYNDFMKQNQMRKLNTYLLAAETGSGKTWAYLASLLTKLKERDLETYQISPEKYHQLKKAQIVRAMILVPTYELVDQIYQTLQRANSIQYDIEQDIIKDQKYDTASKDFMRLPDNNTNLGLRIFKWDKNVPPNKFFDACNQRLDIVITTPGKITSLSKLTNYARPFRYFNGLEFCVFDEADTLLDGSFVEDTTSILKSLRQCRDLVLCTATVPKDVGKFIKQTFPQNSLIRVYTKDVHKIPRKIEVKLIDCFEKPYNGSKMKALAQCIYAIHNDGTEKGYTKRIIVFANAKLELESIRNRLLDYDFREEDIVQLSSNDGIQDRLELIRPFLEPPTKIEDDLDKSQIKVILTTDIMARGLDFKGVKNVIIYDIPRNSSDLMHRIGRTGRMKQGGRVFILLDKSNRKSWMKGLPKVVKESIRMG